MISLRKIENTTALSLSFKTTNDYWADTVSSSFGETKLEIAIVEHSVIRTHEHVSKNPETPFYIVHYQLQSRTNNIS